MAFAKVDVELRASDILKLQTHGIFKSGPLIITLVGDKKGKGKKKNRD